MIVAHKLVKAPVGVEIDSIGLLTKEQFDKHKDIISEAQNSWWIFGDTGEKNKMFVVNKYNGLSIESANCMLNGVRPCIKLKSTIGNNLSPKDPVLLFNLPWTALDDETLLCDNILSYVAYNNLLDGDMNYEHSEVYKYLADWAKCA